MLFYRYEMNMSKQFVIEYNLPLDAFNQTVADRFDENGESVSGKKELSFPDQSGIRERKDKI